MQLLKKSKNLLDMIGSWFINSMRMIRGVNEPGRARLYVNRPGPVMQEENIGLGLGLVVGFFSEKSLGLRKIL